MRSNKKMQKKLLVGSIIFVTMFFVVFIISYSFAGIKSYRIKVPRSTCVGKDLPLSEQESSCEARKYFEDLADDYDIENLYEVWGAFDDEQQEFILTYLSDKDSIKFKELSDLINNIKSKKISNIVDGNEVTVITEIPKNTSIEVEKTEKEKVDIIEDLDVGIVNDNYYSDSYTYDITMNNNKSNYVKNEALITISDLKADESKKYYVYHLLDSVEAINGYSNSNKLITIDSSKLTGDFSKELEAAKGYSDIDNRIYVVLEEANINSDGSISFTTNSFSTFHIVGYTVDFHYDGMTFSIEGESSILLSQVFENLNIDKDVTKIISVTFTNEDLVAVSKIENDWMLTSLQAFNTEEVLTMFFEDGEMFTLDVTDAVDKDIWPNLANRGNYVQTASYHLSYQAWQYASWDLYALDSPATSASSFNGLTMLDSYSDNRVVSSNFQFKLYHPYRWYYVTKYDGGGTLSNGDNGPGDINVSLINSQAKMNVYAITTRTYNGEICTVYQGSVNALSYQTKTVGIYRNNYAVRIGYWTGLFPVRDDVKLGTSESDASNFLYSTSENCGSTVSKGSYSGLTVVLNNTDDYYYDSSSCGYRSIGNSGNELRVLVRTKYKLVFHPGEGTGTMPDQTIIYNDGSVLPACTFTRYGYHFDGWCTSPTLESDTCNRDGDAYSTKTNVAGAVIDLYAAWEGDPSNYTIKYYKQDLNANTYTEVVEDRVVKSSKVGDYTAANIYHPTYTGFTVQTIQEEEIQPDNATVINVYYNRNSYTSTIYHKNKDTLNSISGVSNDRISAQYGSTINVSNYIKNDIVGYKYYGIQNNQTTINVNTSGNTATILYEYTEVPYTVNYYLKDLGSNTYTKVNADTYTENGKIHDNITYNVRTYTGFTLSSAESKDTNGNSYTGNTVEEDLGEVNLYYTRNSYTVTYSYSGTIPSGAPSAPSSVTVEYGTVINLPSISLTGYDFAWSDSSPYTVTGGANIVGLFTPKNDAFYRVRYYLTGTNTEIRNMTEVTSVIYNNSYTVNAPSITGFTLNDSNSKSVTAGYAGSNNEISFNYDAALVNYTVNYCLENLNTSGCTNQTSTLQGYSLDPISYQQSTFTGFTYDHVTNNSNGIINPDGSTVVTVYYTRNSHDVIACVTKDDDATYNHCDSYSYSYGEAISSLTNPSESYYNFSGWVIDTPGISTMPSTMPDHDINVSGVLVRKLRDLTIVADWGQGITGKVASFVLVTPDGDNITLTTDGNGQAVVKDLSVGKTYTVTEVNCDVGYTCGSYVTHTMIDGTNTVTFSNSLLPNSKNWLKSTSRNKNVFGMIQ